MDNPHRIESIDELRTYVAIVEAGSLVTAAASLGVTANAVSRRLSVLEERLGRRLIHRTTRRLSVTEEGVQFHARCRRILDEIDQAEREIMGDTRIRGTLRVAVHSDLIGPTLLGAVAQMLEEATELRVQLRVSNRFIEPIRAGLDLAIYVGTPPPSSLISIALGSLVWGMAAAPTYVKRHGKPTTPDELDDHECLLVLRERRERYWELSKGTGDAQRFAIGGRFETTDSRALAEALYAGIGIGVRLRSEIDAGVRAGTLEHVLPDWQWASTPTFALLPKGRAKLPSVRKLLDALRTTMQQLTTQPDD